MEIKPINKKIKLNIKEVEIMGVPSGNIEEHGVILDFGEDVINLKVGQTLFFKAWCIDIVTIGEDKHYFASADSDGICGVSK